MSTAVFTRLDGELARFEVGTNDPQEAIVAVLNELQDRPGPMHAAPVLALVERRVVEQPAPPVAA